MSHQNGKLGVGRTFKSNESGNEIIKIAIRYAFLMGNKISTISTLVKLSEINPTS